MKEYIVQITETTTSYIRVVADNQDDALSYADMLYLEGDLMYMMDDSAPAYSVQIVDNPLPVQYDTYYDNDHSKFERY